MLQGFNKACVEECSLLGAPASGGLRAQAYAQMGDWKAAKKAMEEPRVLQWTCEHVGMTFPMLVDLGARQSSGEIDVLNLMGGASIMQHVVVPEDMGPLRFESSKLERKELPGRGLGVVAKADIALGELLIAARPIELIRPGDPDWQYQADMAYLEEVLTRRLLHRCMDCDASCIEEVFSLFDGQGHGARWAPHAWRSDDFALPMPQGAASAELYARLRGVVKHNAHRWPGKHPSSSLPAPGLGLWLWPPMINHALESDGRPNCAHVFVGDVMLFRATAPIRAGEEVLDRYSTPLADHFEFTLHTLAAHGMRDPVYEATAASWQALQEGFHGAPPPQLPAEKKPLAETLAAIERKVTWSNGVHSVVLPEYEALRDRYKASKSDSLAPPEVRALNLLCVLGFKFEGRAAALEWRSELARRLGLARPMHFAQVKLWAELLERFEHLKGSLSSKEEKLLEEVDSELSKCAAFWTLGRASMETSAGEWKQSFVDWARGSGYSYEWFSTVSLEEFAKQPSEL
ncbi:Putative oxidoreductase [Durusdinium trenchii]|uniref:Oxidoreductase n=1 Tax=Durusdinium trenchii TaxID=1381693 RepID=A0ABP0KL58_9DINO